MEGNSESNSVQCNSESNSNDGNSIPILSGLSQAELENLARKSDSGAELTPALIKTSTNQGQMSTDQGQISADHDQNIDQDKKHVQFRSKTPTDQDKKHLNNIRIKNI